MDSIGKPEPATTCGAHLMMDMHFASIPRSPRQKEPPLTEELIYWKTGLLIKFVRPFHLLLGATYTILASKSTLSYRTDAFYDMISQGLESESARKTVRRNDGDKTEPREDHI